MNRRTVLKLALATVFGKAISVKADSFEPNRCSYYKEDCPNPTVKQPGCHPCTIFYSDDTSEEACSVDVDERPIA